MKKHIIAIYEKNERYAMGMRSLLMSGIKEPYVIVVYTSLEVLVSDAEREEIEILIVTESAYESDILLTSPKMLIILRENQNFVLEGATLIDRFQSREDILRSVLDVLPECNDVNSTARLRTHHWKVIGVYSPVRRCLQTTFAMTLGQTIGAKDKVLYMNFENYSGLSGLLEHEFDSDIIDLLYFFDCDKDKLRRRIPISVHQLGDLDILPPAASYLDTYERTGNKWIEFFEAIESVTEYQFLILDLTDSMQGLIEVLGYCDRIYTMVKNDRISQMKLMQYENWMVSHSMAEIMSKTMKFNFPRFDDIPIYPDLLTKSELAGYVNAIVKEDIYERETD